MRCKNPLGDGGMCRGADFDCCVLQRLVFTNRPSQCDAKISVMPIASWHGEKERRRCGLKTHRVRSGHMWACGDSFPSLTYRWHPVMPIALVACG